MFVSQQLDYDVSKSAFIGVCVYPSLSLLSLLHLQLMFSIYFRKC